MDEQIVAVYCVCDDLLRALGHQEDRQVQMSDAEVMTTALTAVLWFHGNYERARLFLKEQGYIPGMLSKSRFNRRLDRIAELFVSLFAVLGEHFKALNATAIYAIDTFPVPALDNYRIRRAKLFQGELYRGYIASKKRYYFGLKLHLLVTADGQPVEFFLTPASVADVTGLEGFDFDLPAGAELYADKGYTDYEIEDLLAQDAAITFCVARKRNSKRPVPPWTAYLTQRHRKMIETTGSLLERLLPKSIHAVTARGFTLKVALFVLAVSFNAL